LKRLLGLIIITSVLLSVAACSVVTVTVTAPVPKTPITTTTVSPTPPPAPTQQYALADLRVLPVGGFPISVPAPPHLGQEYKLQLPVCGGMPPYTWAIVVGNLPPGLTMESKGWITGIPTGTGFFTFTAMVTDSTGNSASGTCSLTVDKIPEIATATPTSDSNLNKTEQMWATGKHVDFLINYPVEMLDLAKDQYVAIIPMVMGNKTPWKFIAISLPKGLTCDPENGTIQGPVEAFADGNVKAISIAAKDADGRDSYFSPAILNIRAGYKPPSPPSVAAGSNGILSVSTDRGLVISVSGMGDIGTGGAVVSLPPGSYTVSIRSSSTGKVVWQTNIRIDSGKTTVIKTSGLQ
jgi:hypothetical protein